jgi:superoxide dismutase, Cu-Zn family
MHRVRIVLLLLGALTLGVATVAFAGTDRDDDDDDDRGRSSRVASATVMDSSGARVGQVWFYQQGRDRGVQVIARMRGLPAGFHGFHIHTTGMCTGDFMSAGGHYNPTGAMHPDHAGDLSTLLVNADGTGTLVVETDRFSVSDLRDADGSAVIVHALPDNYANIPERYWPPPPDTATRSTGDAGGRIACGVVR